MINMPFRSPTEYYCESLIPIDEQICALIAKRKELSKNNPGFPRLDLISAWCHKYQLNEHVIRSVFGNLFNEHKLVAHVEPDSLVKFVSILKSVEMDGILHTVTHMKQYENASVVYVETEVTNAQLNVGLERHQFELFISPEYQCRSNGGYGQSKGMQHSFVVTPLLPDDVEDVEFRLTIKPRHDYAKIQAFAATELSVTIK